MEYEEEEEWEEWEDHTHNEDENIHRLVMKRKKMMIHDDQSIQNALPIEGMKKRRDERKDNLGHLTVRRDGRRRD